MRLQRLLCLSVALIVGSVYSAHAQNAARGAEYARTNCSRCHAIEKTGPSPFSEAPPFRTLAQRYPVEALEEALGEGLFTGHPAMPEFTLDADQVGDFIAFLKSLQ